jgi:predicted HTH transcriptional regulator
MYKPMMWAKILLALLLFLWRNGVRKLVYINNDMFNQTYRRSNAGDYKCTRLQVKAILRDQTENTMDMEILDDAELSELNAETIQGYRNRYRTLKAGHPFERLDDAEYLRSIGAAAISREDKRLHPTAAGMLMFGDEFNIVRYFPEYFLDYREMLDPTIRWTDRLQFSSGEWSGNIYDFYFRVYNSDPRNKALMKMFNLINIGERAGSGVPNIFNVWEDEGWVEPVIEERFDPDRTILTLEFKKKSGDKKATKKLRHSMIKYLALWSLTKSIVCRNFVNYLI